MKVTEITGTVTLDDGSKTQFSLGPDQGYQQWGNDVSRLGETVDLMQALAGAAREHMDDEADDEEAEEAEHYDGDGCSTYDSGYVVQIWRDVRAEDINVEDLEFGDVYRDPASDADGVWWLIDNVDDSGDDVHVFSENRDDEVENLHTLADLGGMDPDTTNVVVSAEHRQSLDGPSIHGPFNNAHGAHAWVLQQYATGEFDVDGCTVEYREIQREQ